MFQRMIAALIACVCMLQPANACSLWPGAFIQSNFEMIDASDAIVVARAARKLPGRYQSDKIVFEVETVLKGSPAHEVVDVSARFGQPTPSDPKDILKPNSEALRGGCDRSVYRRGDRYVLMLREDSEEGLVVGGDAFSRINEDDFGPDSMWRRAINIYLSIQKNPDRMAQIADVEELIRKGRSESASEFDKQLATDALQHLRNIHPDKPTQWLLQRLEDPNFLATRLSTLTEGTEEPEADAAASLSFGARPPEDEKTVILRALSEGDHPEAEGIFRSIVEETSPAPTQLGAALAFFIRKGEYDFVKQQFGEHILWIEGVTGEGSGPGFWDVIWPAIGFGDNVKVESEFREWWERQWTANCFLSSDPFSCSADLDNISELLDQPYQNETLILANASNPRVVEWANSELDRLQAEEIPTFKPEWDLPFKALLAAYRGDKPERVHELACGAKEMRERLAHFIGEVPTSYTQDLLREMMSIEQHEHVREQLFQSAVLLAANQMKKSRWRDTGLAYAYARSDGPLPLDEKHEPRLPCLK